MGNVFFKEMFILKLKEVLRVGWSEEYLGGEATTFPFFLVFEEDGFELWGGGEGVAIRDEGCASCLGGVPAATEVRPDEEPIVFDGDNRGDLGRGELGLLGSVSREVDSESSFNGLEA